MTARARHGAALVLAALAMAVAPGCGGSATDTVEAEDPALAFAPLVRLDRDERRLPVGARWFIDRSALWFADGGRCDDRKIAVGRARPAEQTVVTDWIYTLGLAGQIAYYRSPLDDRCQENRDLRFYTDDATRPFHRRDRPKGLRPRDGFYLDLLDSARSGPPGSRGAKALSTPAYVRRAREEVAGRPGLRFTYWMLYGVNEPRRADGSIARDRVHEGDWERVDVLVQRGDGADEYVPVAIVLPPPGGSREDEDMSARGRKVAWSDLSRVAGPGSDTPSHPVLAAARGGHELTPAGAESSCGACPRWRTWARLRAVERQNWYGFGGAWGEPGQDDPTTGPLGPHDRWRPRSDAG